MLFVSKELLERVLPTVRTWSTSWEVLFNMPKQQIDSVLLSLTGKNMLYNIHYFVICGKVIGIY